MLWIDDLQRRCACSFTHGKIEHFTVVNIVENNITARGFPAFVGNDQFFTAVSIAKVQRTDQCNLVAFECFGDHFGDIVKKPAAADTDHQFVVPFVEHIRDVIGQVLQTFLINRPTGRKDIIPDARAVEICSKYTVRRDGECCADKLFLQCE